jgi:hypothetical protein
MFNHSFRVRDSFEAQAPVILESPFISISPLEKDETVPGTWKMGSPLGEYRIEARASHDTIIKRTNMDTHFIGPLRRTSIQFTSPATSGFIEYQIKLIKEIEPPPTKKKDLATGTTMIFIPPGGTDSSVASKPFPAGQYTFLEQHGKDWRPVIGKLSQDKNSILSKNIRTLINGIEYENNTWKAKPKGKDIDVRVEAEWDLSDDYPNAVLEDYQRKLEYSIDGTLIVSDFLLTPRPSEIRILIPTTKDITIDNDKNIVILSGGENGDYEMEVYGSGDSKNIEVSEIKENNTKILEIKFDLDGRGLLNYKLQRRITEN